MKKILALAVWIAALGLLCASCDNGLDIQQAYTFSLETMPVQKRISVGETAEISLHCCSHSRCCSRSRPNRHRSSTR